MYFIIRTILLIINGCCILQSEELGLEMDRDEFKNLLVVCIAYCIYLFTTITSYCFHITIILFFNIFLFVESTGTATMCGLRDGDGERDGEGGFPVVDVQVQPHDLS